MDISLEGKRYYGKKSFLSVSGMELNIIRTTVSVGAMLSFISYSRVMPRVP